MTERRESKARRGTSAGDVMAAGVATGNRFPDRSTAEERNDNPFADPAIVAGYEEWYQTAGCRADRLEKDLLRRLLVRFPAAHSLLEIGSGTGHFTRWLKEQSLQVVGLDLAIPMLAEAITLDGVRYVCGDAHTLPFADEAFDIVTLITTLEFVSNPERVLLEALRTAGQGLILGVLNRHSLLGWQRVREGGPLWGTARFFTPWELVHLLREVSDRPVQITWQTTLWPVWLGALPLPWGGFIGMAMQWA